MKHKFSSMWRVAIALVLALSLVVMAVPVGADSPADTDVGFEFNAFVANGSAASWDKSLNTDATTGYVDALGSYSVKLTQGDTYRETNVAFTPAEALTLADLATIGNTSFYYNTTDMTYGRNIYADLVFSDPDSEGFADVALQWHHASETAVSYDSDWHKLVVDVADLNVNVNGNTTNGVFFAAAGHVLSLANVLTTTSPDGINALMEAADAQEPDVDAANWVLTSVRAGLYDAQDDDILRIDNITFDGTTYELEPIFLDAEYYSVGDTVEVTVPNFKANTDAIRVNPVTGEGEEDTPKPDWEVSVISDSDAEGIIVDLEETGMNTGVFAGSFASTDTLPAAENELYVQDGDDITVTYAKEGDWGTGVNQPADLTHTAEVDDTAPTIDTLEPGEGDKVAVTKPAISAAYSDDPNVSGIDVESVEILLDGVDVTDDTTPTGSGVTYTPTEDLVDGSYDVTVNVSDNAGNEATESWSFRVVSWLVDEVSVTNQDSLDELDTVGIAVSGAGDTADITVGRYASNPEPEAPLTFTMIENGFFDVQVLQADATQIVIKFADADNITAESTAHVWDDLEGAWLECSDKGYNSLNDYLWVKVRTDTTPNIAELEGTPFAISGEEAVEEISAYYKGYSGDAEVVEITDLLKAANDWADEVVPPDFTEAISITELLALANEWAATP